jgi:serine-type D-Ala-D-Ala carboxypeptidase (penicillin-binding protein 5/6)
MKKWWKLGLLAAVLVMLPGQNEYQALQVKPRAPRVRGAAVSPPAGGEIPVNGAGVKAPMLTARAAMVVDVGSGTVMYQKNAQTPLLPASITKLMTALIALETYDLNEVLTVKRADEAIGQSMGLRVGEKITAGNLVYGLLVKSGNDAALALGENYPDGYAAFVEAMNQKAKDWQMTDTVFKNVSGVEQWGHVTTVRDLAVLAREATKNEVVTKMAATKSITVKDVSGEIEHELKNINQLLGQVEGLRGLKTGWTTNAGECLITDTIRNGKEVITVVLGSEDRFGESAALIEWAFGNHEWKAIGSI